MPALPPIRCVCFDWGGVILRHCRSWAEACARAGIPVREGIDDPALAARRREINADYQRGVLTAAEFFQLLSAATNGVYTPGEVANVHSAWLIDEYEGLRHIIESLNTRIDTALLSNTNPSHWARHMPKLDGSPADFPTISLLKHKHASHLLGLAKPEVQIFRVFERHTRLRPAEILFFDDLADNVAAARSAGWNAELIDHTRETAPQIREHLRRHGVLVASEEMARAAS